MKEPEIKKNFESFIRENLTHSLSSILGVKGLEIISLGNFMHEYLTHKEQNCSEKYIQSIKISFNHLSNYFDKQKLLNHIDLKQMESFTNFIKEKAPKGYRVYFRNLKAAFNKAKDWGYISENPMLKIKLPKKVLSPPIFITELELQQVVKTINNNEIKDIVVLAFYTGMRMSEILNLRWSSVNLTQRTITVGDKCFDTKSRKQRVIPIANIVHRLLENRIRKVIENNKSFVFQKLPGISFNSDHVSKIFKRTIRKLRMDDQIHFHSLRHSFASNLKLKGVSIYELRDLLGHSSVQTTEIYAHLTIDKLRSAVDKFNTDITNNIARRESPYD